VRYFRDEDPEDILFENSASLLAAGLGLRAKVPVDRGTPLEHDFAAGWELREIVNLGELERESLPQLWASWAALKCCFT